MTVRKILAKGSDDLKRYAEREITLCAGYKKPLIGHMKTHFETVTTLDRVVLPLVDRLYDDLLCAVNTQFLNYDTSILTVRPGYTNGNATLTLEMFLGVHGSGYPYDAKFFEVHIGQHFNLHWKNSVMSIEEYVSTLTFESIGDQNGVPMHKLKRWTFGDIQLTGDEFKKQVLPSVVRNDDAVNLFLVQYVIDGSDKLFLSINENCSLRKDSIPWYITEGARIPMFILTGIKDHGAGVTSLYQLPLGKLHDERIVQYLNGIQCSTVRT